MMFSLVARMLPEERVHGSHSLSDEAHFQEEVGVGIGIFSFLSADARRLQAAEAKIRVQSKDGHKFVFRHGGKPDLEAGKQEPGFQSGSRAVRRICY